MNRNCIVVILGLVFALGTLTANQAEEELPSIEELRASISTNRLEMDFNDAVADGNLDAVKEFIQEGFDPLAPQNLAKSYLYLAIQSDNAELLQYLLELGLDINVVGEFTGPLLHQAAWIGNPEMVSCLLEHGADVHAVNKDGETALHDAASGRSMETIQLLIDAGAEIDVEDSSGDTPLNAAVRYGVSTGVELLLNAGADPNHYDSIPHLPLGTAVMRNNERMVRVLLAGGADVNLPVAADSPGSCLSSAIFFSEPAILELLVTAGAEIEDMDSEGYTPLQDAVFRENDAAADILLAGGAFYDIFSAAGRGDIARISMLVDSGLDLSSVHPNGLSAIHWAGRFGQADAVSALANRGLLPDIFCHAGVNDLAGLADDLRAGADLDQRDSQKLTPLHYAVANGNLEAVNFLGINGATIDIEGDWHGTPLEMAIDGGFTNIAKRLVDLGAAVDGVEDQYTQPLHHAIEQHDYEMASYLLANGADLYIQYGGRTGVSWLPLEHALMEHDLQMAELLLNAGYYVDAVSPDGVPAIDIAITFQNVEGVRFLLENGADANQTIFSSPHGMTGYESRPIKSAYYKYNQEIIDLLLDYGAELPDEVFLRMNRQHEASNRAHSQRFFDEKE